MSRIEELQHKTSCWGEISGGVGHIGVRPKAPAGNSLVLIRAGLPGKRQPPASV